MKNIKLIILFVIITFCSCNQDKNSWESAQSINTVASYKDYMSKFPNGEYKSKADSCIQVLVWYDAQQTNTVESYENYIIVYPNGHYKLTADSLLEESLWIGASTNWNMEYYVKYNEKFPNGKYISKVKDYVDKYLIEPEHAGVFKIGMDIPFFNFKGFEIVKEEITYFNVFSGSNNIVTEYFVTLKGNKLLELFLNDYYCIEKIKILSDKFKTRKNISIKSTINYFKSKYSNYFISGEIIDTYTSEEEYFYVFAKGENGVEFEINEGDISENTKIIGIQICHKDEDEYASHLKYVQEQKAHEKQEEERQAQALRERQANNSNNSQTSRSSSNQSTKGYNRTSRDYFENESAIHEFLSNHTFVSSDGSKLTYSIGELIIKFPSSRLQLINPNILGYNQERAIIRFMSTQANVTIKFTIDASNGTITDGQTVYRAIN